MLRSRMFTPLFRLFAGWAIAATVLAAIFGIASNPDNPLTFGGDFPWIHNNDLINTLTGPITLGWKGPVGSHLGYIVWLSLALAAAFLAGLLIAFRDADPDAEAEAVHTETVPLTRAPSGASYWPIIGAFGVGMIGIGWVSNGAVFVAGIGLLAVTAVVWTFRAWADRATGDDEVNREIYNRFIDPVRIPVLSIGAIAVVVFGLSRVLLAVSREAAIVVFLGTFVFFGLLFTLIAFVPKASKGVLTAVFLVLAAAFLIGGVVAAVKGERPFGEEQAPAGEGTGSGGGGSGTGEGGLAPVQPPTPSIVVQVTR
ncbi:MAG: hypothetical protein HYX32_13625 [Actinobacteria bacterium]|nr:hypothetical protein [Actinomycetota bacterium]